MPVRNQDIPELPRIRDVDVFREEAWAVAERCPVRVDADHRAEIGRLHLEAATEIDVVRFHDSGLRVLQRPDHAGEHRGRHLEAGGVLVRRELACLLDGELGPIPVGVLGMAVEQHAELVDAVDDLVLRQDVVLPLELSGIAEHLVHREHGVVGRVIRVVASRTSSPDERVSIGSRRGGASVQAGYLATNGAGQAGG